MECDDQDSGNRYVQYLTTFFSANRFIEMRTELLSLGSATFLKMFAPKGESVNTGSHLNFDL